MKKIKVAQIGTSRNSHGTAIWKTLLALPELFDVVGYAFPEGEKERFPEWAKYFDGHREMTVEEILSDPEIEAVTVETEEIHLVKYAQMVADAGKHLRCPGQSLLQLSADLRSFRFPEDGHPRCCCGRRGWRPGMSPAIWLRQRPDRR